MSPLETHLDIGIMLRSKVDESGNVYSLYPITRDIDVALTTEGENGELTLDDKLKTYDAKHQEYTDNIENLQKSTWSGTKEELMTAIENGEIADGTTVYITDDYSGDGQDLSVFATIDYVNDTFVPLEEGKGLSSTDVTSDDVDRWNTSSDIAARLDGDATVDGSVAQKIAGVISGAPEKYDTLVEIANWIESDTDGAAAMDLKISENTKNIELKLDKDGGDTMDNITTFTSNDATESTSWTDVDVMGSGEKHSGLFSKISTMFKNIRYLYKLLGTTDISKVGDGTVSGAISTLNSNMSSSTKYASVTGAGWYRIAKYAVSDDSSKAGAGDNSVDIVIQRNYNNEDNEHHEFKVMSIYNHQEFVDVCNKSNAHRFTKARYTYDSDGAYIEVYYSNNIVNDFRITLSHILSGSKTTHWEPICEKTSETVDGVTITATYDIPSYSAVTQLKTQIDSLNSNIGTRFCTSSGTYIVIDDIHQYDMGFLIIDISGSLGFCMVEFFIFKETLTISPSSITSNNSSAKDAYDSLSFSYTKTETNGRGELTISTNQTTQTTGLKVTIFHARI